ncbi:MAG TPA: WcaF family extracellular polysaccharide biosynthesis acetyltransferase [Rariglobus sp.]|jgi:putative colanic acid biosynthesis acetyltransferase WcaF|nr:WcaF family extracellular polysaccharide biosynthesis acetyltransferase [Rariglobus sp.]
MKTTRVRNDLFDASQGFDRGRPVWVFALWQLIKWMFFRTIFPWPSALKVWLLRVFGAEVGAGVCIKPQVNIHLPWKLELGDHAWIGEEAFILNFEPVKIGAHACISQRAFLCGGNHDFRDPAMCYRNAPIVIGAGAWIGAQVFVASGVTIGDEAVVTAGSVVTQNMPAGMICGGNPCVPIKARWPADR